MRKVFQLKGLDCANCAAKMEDRIKKLDGVSHSSVNFMTAKLVIEGDEEKMTGIIESAKAVIKKLEPGVKMENA